MYYYLESVELEGAGGVPVTFSLFVNTFEYAVHCLDLSECEIGLLEAMDGDLERRILELIPIQLDFYNLYHETDAIRSADLYRRKFTVFIYKPNGDIVKFRYPSFNCDITKPMSCLHTPFQDICKIRKFQRGV